MDGQHRDYIAYSGYQNCTGEFISQRVCVKLQERDYYGHYYDRTTYSCSVETVEAHASKGRSVLCSAAGQGTFRTAAYGNAYPEEGTRTSTTVYSVGEPLC